MKDAARNYNERMQRVLAHIDAHPDGDLSIEALAAVAAFSKFHFHRQFSEIFGLPPARYVQLARVRRASWRLAIHGDTAITELAFDSGFDTPEGFSRAFKRHTGRTPSEFRDDPVLPSPEESLRMPTEAEVRIVDFPATPVAVLAHRGDPTRIWESVRAFIAWRRRVGLPPATSATFNVFHGPGAGAGVEERIDLCAATDRPIAPNPEGVRAGLIPGGRCAVLRHVGPAEDLRWAGRFLYAEWLPGSGEELRDFPLFVQRVRFHPEVPQHEVVTDVFLPLR
jgi:AraC family transcriptional regulator